MLSDSDLIEFQVDVDCPSKFDDSFTHAGEPNLAINCVLCFFWVGENDDHIFCSYPRALAKSFDEASEDREIYGFMHRNAIWISTDKLRYLEAIRYLQKLNEFRSSLLKDEST